MNVVIYARYSSHSQTEQSIEGQIAVCQEYAERNNYTIIGEYIDRALSGTNDNRENFQRMIQDSNKKLFQGVLVYQLDRFSRNRYDSAIYKNKLKKNGVRVFSAKENISDDASGILMESVIEGMAEYYSVELAQKVTRGMKINAEKCLYNGGYVPLGYKIENKKFQINEETAPIVRKIFELYCNDFTIKDIVEYLNSRNIKNGYNRSFCKSSITNLLKNKQYIGYYKYKDVETKNGVPQIIDEEIFNKAQKRLEKNKRTSRKYTEKVEYILTTKLFCGKCKEMMVGTCGTSRNKVIHNYYMCNGKKKKKCNKKNIQKEYIEDIVVKEAKNILTDENIDKISKNISKIIENQKGNSTIKNLEKDLKKLEKQKYNLMESLKVCDNDSIRKSIFEEFEKMEESKKIIDNEILEEKLQNNFNIDITQIKFFLNQLKNGDINDARYRKLLVTVFIDKVYVYDDHLYIIFNVTDKKNFKEVSVIDSLECSDNDQSAPPKKHPFGCFLFCFKII